MIRARLGAAAALIVASAALPTPAGHLVAQGGLARMAIVIDDRAGETERHAAAELARYLGRSTGAAFEVADEREAGDRPAIHVGATARVRAIAGGAGALGPEEWRIRSQGRDLLLHGGSPRGTLYAVYAFLEREIGVAWWTPFEDDVPRRRRLTVATQDRSGRPAFSFRDLYGVEGPVVFRARSRLNGHFSFLPAAWGGRESYGPPGHVHNVYDYVPPERVFDAHPEYFSEIAGLRVGQRAQLCPTAPGLADFIASRMLEFVERGREEAAAAGEPPPTLFAISPNDWGRECECPVCSALAEREGGRAGPWVSLVNAVAERVAEREPAIRIDTLAYWQTFDPPKTLALRPEVVLRVSALHDRVLSRPLTDPVNAKALGALREWRERAGHLRVWDYALVFLEDGELPLANLEVIAADIALYARFGVEGVYVQHDGVFEDHLGDLKLWVVSQLLVDPRRPLEALVRAFTDGYYGAAAPEIRAYLGDLSRAEHGAGATIRFGATPADYSWLDGELIARAHGRFRRAERRVALDRERLRRVRHARLALDRATLVLWPKIDAELARRGGPTDPRAIAERYRRVWDEQCRRRLGSAACETAAPDRDRRIDRWLAAAEHPPRLRGGSRTP